MSISDLLSGLTIFPVLAIQIVKKSLLKNCFQERAASYVLFLLTYFSISISCCTAIDRYFRVMKQNRYSLYMNSFRMKIMIVASIIAANIFAILSIAHPSFTQQVVAVSFSLLLVCFFIILYTILLQKLRNHSKQLMVSRFDQHKSSPGGNLDNRSRMKEAASANRAIPPRMHGDRNTQLSAVKTIQILLIFVVIFCTPYHVMSCWWTYYRYRLKTDPAVLVNVLFAWSAFLALLFASWNSWILICGNRQSRRFVFSLFRRNRTENGDGT